MFLKSINVSLHGKRRIFIIGDSHTDALKRVLKLREANSDAKLDIVAYRYSKMKNGAEIGDLSTEQAEKMVSELTNADLLISTTGGNQHQMLGLVRHPVLFDFHIPGEYATSLLDGAEAIPYGALWEVFERGLRGKDGERLLRLRAAAGCPVIHLAPPPPKEDESHILRRFETAFAEKGIAEFGVTPASVRLKLWQLQVRVLASLCAEWNIQLLPPPAGTQTPDGYLKPEFYANDATHANEAYGELVLRQLEALSVENLREQEDV